MSGSGFKMGFAGRAVLAGGALGMAFMAGPAQATIYNWTWQDDGGLGGWTSSGQFDETGGTITAFSGTWDGVTISGLSPLGTLGGDNHYPLDFNGVAFSLDSPLPGGSTIVNVYEFFGGTWFGNVNDTGYGTFTATAVPEPASAALLGTAVAGLLAGARRRRVKAVATA